MLARFTVKCIRKRQHVRLRIFLRVSGCRRRQLLHQSWMLRRMLRVAFSLPRLLRQPLWLLLLLLLLPMLAAGVATAIATANGR